MSEQSFGIKSSWKPSFSLHLECSGGSSLYRLPFSIKAVPKTAAKTDFGDYCCAASAAEQDDTIQRVFTQLRMSPWRMIPDCSQNICHARRQSIVTKLNTKQITIYFSVPCATPWVDPQNLHETWQAIILLSCCTLLVLKSSWHPIDRQVCFSSFWPHRLSALSAHGTMHPSMPRTINPRCWASVFHSRRTSDH